MIRRSVIVLLLILAPATVGLAVKLPGSAEVQAEFKTVFEDWKELIAKLRQLQEQYQVATTGQRPKLEAEYARLVAEGRKMAPRLAAAAERAYAAAPNRDKNVTDFLSAKLADDVQSDSYEDAARVSKLLIDNGFDDKTLYGKAAVAAFATHDFPAARKDWQRASDLGEMDERGKRLMAETDSYEQFWEKEQAIRKAEAEADNLPRVKLATNKGDIVVELFENEAPIATANFISLVENHFYDGLKFHRVIPAFMAQGGDPKGSGRPGPGYTIPGEADKKDHRLFFRGSLGMGLVPGDPDSGDSQFFLTFLPTPHLNGRHTAFGRVIEGMEVLAKLERTENAQGQKPRRLTPDVIVKASVLRKRDHKYEPKKLPAK